MARVVVTTNDGEVIDVFEDTEIGDLDKEFNRRRLLAEIKRQVELARAEEQEEA